MKRYFPRQRPWLAVLVAALNVAIAAPPRDARAQGASLERATAAQKAEAKDKYRAGMSAFGNEKYDEALELFRASYDAVKSPNSHLMIARTLARQGQLIEARMEFESVRLEAEEAAKSSDKYEQTATAAAAEVKELDSRLAFVRTKFAGAVTVAGKPAPASAPEPIVVLPGEVEIRWTLPNGTEATQSVTAKAGETVDVELTPPEPKVERTEPAAPPPAPPAPPSGISQRRLGYVVGGIGIGGFALFGVFGALNNARFDDLEAQCPNNICPPDLADKAEQGRRFKAVANAGLGIGIAGLASGLVLVLTAPKAKPTARAKAPRLHLGARSVSLSGKF